MRPADGATTAAPRARVLIVGGGIGGLALACGLADRSFQVSVVEDSAEVNGSGLGFWPYLRPSLDSLGLSEIVDTHGYLAERVLLCDQRGNVVGENLRQDGTRLPAELVISRPVLVARMLEAARTRGATVKGLTSYTSITNGPGGVDVTLTDGTTDRFDLVVGADGARSAIRADHIDAITKPIPSDSGIFRCLVPQVDAVPLACTFQGANKIVYMYPAGSGLVYAGIYTGDPEPYLSPEETRERALELLAEYDAPQVEHFRASLVSGQVDVTYRRLTTHLVEPTWYRGRIVLIGDAAHTMPPNVSGGASMAIEDAAALAESLAECVTIDEALEAFMARRLDRVRRVVTDARRVLARGPRLDEWAANSHVHEEMFEALTVRP